MQSTYEQQTRAQTVQESKAPSPPPFAWPPEHVDGPSHVASVKGEVMLLNRHTEPFTLCHIILTTQGVVLSHLTSEEIIQLTLTVGDGLVLPKPSESVCVCVCVCVCERVRMCTNL